MTKTRASNNPYSHLRPRNSKAFQFVLGFSLFTAAGIAFSCADHPALWLLGQLLLSVAMLQWFVVIHECGHGTFFRTRWLNTVTGHVASLFSAIPFYPWRSIHQKHHIWTGWQDRDPTTENLVPRKLATFERVIINTCWKFWIPIFSLMYRTHNFWNLPRLRKHIPPKRFAKTVLNIVIVAAVYVGAAVVLGPWLWLKVFGLAFAISLILAEPILMSQHNHIPQKLSDGEEVKPHLPKNQGVFTRSLRFPPSIARYILLNFDAHELHHTYPHIPGYDLDSVDEPTENLIHWWSWLKQARQLPAEDYMFKNRDETGVHI